MEGNAAKAPREFIDWRTPVHLGEHALENPLWWRTRTRAVLSKARAALQGERGFSEKVTAPRARPRAKAEAAAPPARQGGSGRAARAPRRKRPRRPRAKLKCSPAAVYHP